MSYRAIGYPSSASSQGQMQKTSMIELDKSYVSLETMVNDNFTGIVNDTKLHLIRGLYFIFSDNGEIDLCKTRYSLVFTASPPTDQTATVIAEQDGRIVARLMSDAKSCKNEALVDIRNKVYERFDKAIRELPDTVPGPTLLEV